MIALTRGAKRKKDYVWTECQQESFERLKLALMEAPVLCFPDWTKPFYIETDASDFGIGAILSQEHGDGPDGYPSLLLVNL